jgi:SAM-dependent methyltransferase
VISNTHCAAPLKSSLTNTPYFIADRYRNARPLYPRAVFRTLERVCAPGELTTFLDLACGAGQSTRAFLDLGISRRGFAVDPDLEMLAAARARVGSEFPAVKFLAGRAEKIPLADASVDLVLIGSAIHWFDLPRAHAEITRVLKPGGILFVFEYQFPKCLDVPDLAEVVRRRFNLEWRAPRQTPRGTLADLLAPFRKSPAWRTLGEDRPNWIESLSCETFLGHLFSQSRVLHAEAAAPNPASYRAEIEAFFRPYFAAGLLQFDFKPRAAGLRLVSKPSRVSTEPSVF